METIKNIKKKYYTKPTSFSQNVVFWTCPRTWYLSYILKVPKEEDLMYANRGSVVHHCLEEYYPEKKTSIEKIRDKFEKEWKQYKLYDTKLKNKKEETWQMIKQGVAMDLFVTDTELKIFYKDAVAYLDIVDSKNHIISDWKTSTRSLHNEKQYLLQVKYYAWLYYRKFGVVPTFTDVKYLKYEGENSSLGVSPTLQDINAAEKWNNKTRELMNYYINNPKKLPEFNKDFFFCPYKHLFNVQEKLYLKDRKEHNIKCQEETIVVKNIDNNVVNIIIKNGYLYLYSNGFIDDFLEKHLTKKFSYTKKDAYSIKKRNPYANVVVNFYNRQFKRLAIGFLNDLLKTLSDYIEFKKQNIKIKIIDERVFNKKKIKMPDHLLSDKQLRDYQKKAVNAYLENEKNKISIIEIATGGGKTLVASEIIRKLQMTTLFVVEKTELLYQTKEKLEEELGIEVGIIGDGAKDIKDVTVATIQTLNRNIESYRNFLANIRFLIVDECHHSASDSYLLISKYLKNTEYRLGLTATNKRDDKKDMNIVSVLGKVCYKIPAKVLIEKKYLILPTITFIKLNYSDKDILFLKERLKKNVEIKLRKIRKKQPTRKELTDIEKYNLAYDIYIVDNEIRNNYIKDLVNMYNQDKNLILVTNRDHGFLLEKQINEMFIKNNIKTKCNYFHGELNKKVRKQIYEDFVKSKSYTLIATLSIFAEGLDVPSLKNIINACGNKGEVKTLQTLGRILRLFAEKNKAYFFDFFDKYYSFHNASKKRKKYFENEGYKINVRDLSEK